MPPFSRSLGKNILKYPLSPLTLRCGKAFIVSRAPVTSMLRWFFDFHSHDGCIDGGRASMTLWMTDKDCWLVGQSGSSLVTSLYRQRGAERSRSPERIGKCPIKHTFDGRRNDCSWKPIRDLARNASCILKGAQSGRPSTLGVELGVPARLRMFGQRWRNATCPIERCLRGPR